MKKKIINLRKLPSGSYLFRKMINGKNYNITFDHMPSQREIDDALFLERKKEGIIGMKDSFHECAKKMYSNKDVVDSPSTLVGYDSILNNLSDTFLALPIDQITAQNIQDEINTYAVGRSPKTVRNASGLISHIVKYYRPDMVINTKLPQKEKKEIEIHSDDEAKKILEAIKGSKYECAILLAVFGMRRSEVLALTSEDIVKDNTIQINKAIVINRKKEYVEKVTKTTESTRYIYVPDRVIELLKQNGKAYEGHPQSILKYLHKVQRNLGIPQCTYHSLRHYYVSTAHELGVPDAYIANAVGHSNIQTTQNIYTHIKKDKLEGFDMKTANFIEKNLM